MKNENYITIQGWMINELELSGQELNCYALIYGFSQDGESEFRGSLKYVCKCLRCSKNTAMSILLKLVKKGFIVKEEFIINNIKLNKYKSVKNFNSGAIIAPPVQFSGAIIAPPSGSIIGLGGAIIEPLGGAIIAPNITILNNTNNNTKYNNIILEKFEKFIEWININSPRVQKMENPLTIDNFVEIMEKYNPEFVREVFLKMENYKPLLKKNLNAYLTMINWIKREYGDKCYKNKSDWDILPKSKDIGKVILNVDEISVIKNLIIEKQISKPTDQTIIDNFEIFKKERFLGAKEYKTPNHVVDHFINWIKSTNHVLKPLVGSEQKRKPIEFDY